MSLPEEYGRQLAWRSWKRIFEKLPLTAGQVVLDLGCGIGDQAREFAARGVRVIGIDLNQKPSMRRGRKDFPIVSFDAVIYVTCPASMWRRIAYGAALPRPISRIYLRC